MKLVAHKFSGVTIPTNVCFKAPSLDEIKKRAQKPKSGPPLSVDAQGKVNPQGSGTKVPSGTFHSLAG